MSVTVRGSAVVDVEPDVVVAELGVDVREGDVSTALASATAGLERLRQALLDAGVERPDLRSTTSQTWREDRYENNAVVGTVIHVTLGLRATLRDAEAAGATVGAALAAAGDVAQLTSLSFGVSDRTAALAQARDAAFDDARAVAQAYAARAGRALGPVTAVVEEPSSGPPRTLKARGAADAAFSSELTIELGQEGVGAAVTVTWALLD